MSAKRVKRWATAETAYRFKKLYENGGKEALREINLVAQRSGDDKEATESTGSPFSTRRHGVD